MSINARLHSPLNQLEHKDFVFGGFIFAGILILYIRTLAPDLLLGDSGEFQTLMYTIGMTHPTGYPVFILLGRLFTLLPVGEFAWRANLFVAVLGAITACNIYAIVRIMVGWRMPSVFAAISLAVMPLFWFHAVIAELYVPACLFSSSVILLILYWKQSDNERYLLFAGMVGGLSLGVHSTVALIVPAVLIYLLIAKASKVAWKKATIGALIGLILFFGSFALLDGMNQRVGYYHASIEHALSTWEMNTADFDTLPERFRFMYFGKQFQNMMFADPQRVMASNGEGLLEILKSAFLPGSLVLVPIGFILLLVTHWKENLLLIIGALSQMLFALNYEVFDYYVFFIPILIFLAIWIGSGLGMIVTGIQQYLTKKNNLLEHSMKKVNAFLGLIVISLTFFWLPVIVDAWQTKSVSFAVGTPLDGYPFTIHSPEEPHQLAQTLVEALEENAMVFTDWDMLFPYYFVSAIELQNQQIDFYETYPQDESDGLAETTYELIVENLDRPVYFTDRPHGGFASKLSLVPVKRGSITLFQVQGVKE